MKVIRQSIRMTVQTVAVRIFTSSDKWNSAAILSREIRPNSAVTMPQRIYPTDMNSLRRFNRSLSVPITKVVITAVAADSATIMLMADITGIVPLIAACDAPPE